MAAGVYETTSARLSLGSNASGSRRHSLLSNDGSLHLDTSSYDYANSWSLHGDKLSRWRRTYIASETGDAEGVQSTSLALPDESRFTTCMAMSEDQPLLAVGSGSYDTNMFFVQSLDDQLDVKASFASKFPIYSLAFQSNLLMAGTDRNTSVLYKVDRARLLGYASENGESDSEDGPLVKCVGTYKNKAAKSIDIAAPGNHVPTRRVACVAFSPPFTQAPPTSQQQSAWPPASVQSTSALFLSCLGGVINVWDATRNQHALRVEKVSNQPLSSAAWSLQSPSNLIAAGGVDGVVNVLDLRRRGKAVAWRTALPESAGYGAWLSGRETNGDGWGINDVAWSPFVPYWLASAGENGQVNVWDLRFSAANGAAVTTLRHPTNYGSIKSLAWSPTHVDLISTGTSDKSWWLHSLRVEESEETDGALGSAGKDGTNASDSANGGSAKSTERRTVRAAVVSDRRAAEDIGSVVSVCAKGNTFYTLSSCGDLYAHRVTQNALSSAAIQRINGETFHRAESAVYSRDIKSAAETVLGLMDRLKEETDHTAVISRQAQSGGSNTNSSSSSSGHADTDIDSALADIQSHPVMKHAETIKSLCDLFKAKPKLTSAAWTLPPPSVALAPTNSSIADGQSAPATPLDAETFKAMASASSSNKSKPSAAYMEFVDDLDVFGYGLPPGYPLEATALRDPLVWQALEKLNMANLRVKLANIVMMADDESSSADGAAAAGKAPPKGPDGRPLWKSVMDREKQIVQYVKADPSLFDARLLRRVVKLILPHDCIAGLSLGLGICQAYLEHTPPISCSELDGLVHVLLFPTVFDTDTSVSQAASNSAQGSGDMAARAVVTPDVPMVRQRIREFLVSCPEVVFEMIRLEMKVQEAVLRGGEQSQVAEAIVSTMKDHARVVGKLLGRSKDRDRVQIHPAYPATTTMSASAVRMYLNAIVPMRSYDEYLVNTQWWRVLPPKTPSDEGHAVGTDHGWLSSYPLARMLNRQTATIVIPRFRKQIDVVLATIQKEPLSLEPRLYRDTLVKVARTSLLMRYDHALQFAVTSAPKKGSEGSGSSDAHQQSVVTTSIPPNLLSSVFDEIGSAFLMVLEALTRHTGHRDSHKRAASEATPLRDALAVLVESEGRRSARGQEFDEAADVRRADMAAVARYLRQLEQYADATPTE
ncbi:hypothetical protein GQ54DRAFT_297067 [Martensiomyces pterosporus]|nr:hypothetical protein GQ54DRAFT_297067 [Martensiomyces pterosporus]